MKRRSKKLSLHRETLRELSERDGAKVAGGIRTDRTQFQPICGNTDHCTDVGNTCCTDCTCP